MYIGIGDKFGKLRLRQKYLAQFERAIKRPVEVCGEPGILCAGCVSEKDIDALGLKVDDFDNRVNHAQRRNCSCIGAKHELLTRKGRCPHCCAYCYWQD